jgi:calcium-dependent protein kinase
MNMFVKMTTEDQLTTLTDKFKEMDLDGTGMISLSEIKVFIEKQNLNITSDELKKMIAELDCYGNGKINYTEFLSATVDTSIFLNEAKQKSVFAMFDTDGSGIITQQNMFFAF